MRAKEFINPKQHGSLEKTSFKMSTLGGSPVDGKPMTANELASQKKQKLTKKDK